MAIKMNFTSVVIYPQTLQLTNIQQLSFFFFKERYY